MHEINTLVTKNSSSPDALPAVVMNDNDNEQVDLACCAFRNSVQAFCRRYTSEKNQLPRALDVLVDHSCHCLRQLASKQRSLQSGLSYLKQVLWPQVLEGFQKNAAHRALLLKHFLAQCLRLHDGMLLLVSGECRHKGDIRLAKKQTKFRSQLASQQERGDGYTKLFNAPGGYSGYGWDEFHDPQVGIKERLLQALQRYSAKGKKRKSKEKIWEFLLAHGSQSFEVVLDQQESSTKGFIALKEKVVRDLKLFSAKTAKNTKVSLALHDKMEKLQYGDITLERQGDQFQVGDPKGALPCGYSRKHWEQTMKLPTLPEHRQTEAAKPQKNAPSHPGKSAEKGACKNKDTKKRRRILEDSSDEEETVVVGKEAQPKQKRVAPKTESPPLTPTAPNKISGLNVKIRKEKKTSTPREAACSSLTTIKAKFGVEGESLEASRAVLEQEEANASKAAKEEEKQAMAMTIKQGEASIRSQRRVLKRVVERDDRCVNEVWDARELLREQLMAVGNQILWEPANSSSSQAPEDVDRKPLLLAARKHFHEAKAVVDEQERFRRYLNSQGKYSPLEARFFARNLLLLLGQAYTNMGIANVELAEVTKRKTNYKVGEPKQYLQQAVEELSTGSQYAESLRLRSVWDREKGSNLTETAFDLVKADQLESLSTRWLGQALWRQGLRKEAVAKFDVASSAFSRSSQTSTDHVTKDEAFYGAMLQLGAECYYAHSSLADLAFEDMTTLPLTGAVQQGNDLFSYAKRALENASDTSEAIREYCASTLGNEDYLGENDILGREEIQQWWKECGDWWDGRKAIANRPIQVDSIARQHNPSNIQRGELESSGLPTIPKRRFVIGETQRKNKRRRGATPMYHKNSGELLSALPRYSESTHDAVVSGEGQPKRCRPWGDELLPKLGYPSVAPEMPAHIRLHLES